MRDTGSRREVVSFLYNERKSVMLDRYNLDEFTPMERVTILLDSGLHLERPDLTFLTEEVSDPKERKKGISSCHTTLKYIPKRRGSDVD